MIFRELFAKEGLSLDRLRTLILVNDAGSIAAAAPDDRSRQSLYSRQLNELEHFFPVALKQLDGRTVRLTAAGCELALLARQYLEHIDGFRRACEARPREVSLAAGDSLIQWWLLPRFAHIKKGLPEIIWHLHNERNIDIGRSLTDQSLDFGLLRADLVRGRLKSKSLGKVGYSLFIPNQLSMPGEKASLPKALADLPIATQGDDTLFQHRLDEIVTARKWTLNACLYCDSFPQVAKAVASGSFAGILPDYAGSAVSFSDTWTIPFQSGFHGLSREITLAWNPLRLSKHPILEKVRDALIENLSLPSPPLTGAGN
jgi:DNA-binding transcriptional LysR family regulator